MPSLYEDFESFNFRRAFNLDLQLVNQRLADEIQDKISPRTSFSFHTDSATTTLGIIWTLPRVSRRRNSGRSITPYILRDAAVSFLLCVDVRFELHRSIPETEKNPNNQELNKYRNTKGNLLFRSRSKQFDVSVKDEIFLFAYWLTVGVMSLKRMLSLRTSCK